MDRHPYLRRPCTDEDACEVRQLRRQKAAYLPRRWRSSRAATSSSHYPNDTRGGGLGSRIGFGKELEAIGVKTAADLAQVEPDLARRLMTVTGGLTVLELRGVSCMPLERVEPMRKGIAITRSLAIPFLRGSK